MPKHDIPALLVELDAEMRSAAEQARLRAGDRAPRADPPARAEGAGAKPPRPRGSRGQERRPENFQISGDGHPSPAGGRGPPLIRSGIAVAESLAITRALPRSVSAKIGTPVPPWTSAFVRAASRTVPEAQAVVMSATATSRSASYAVRPVVWTAMIRAGGARGPDSLGHVRSGDGHGDPLVPVLERVERTADLVDLGRLGVDHRAAGLADPLDHGRVRRSPDEPRHPSPDPLDQGRVGDDHRARAVAGEHGRIEEPRAEPLHHQLGGAEEDEVGLREHLAVGRAHAERPDPRLHVRADRSGFHRCDGHGESPGERAVLDHGLADLDHAPLADHDAGPADRLDHVLVAGWIRLLHIEHVCAPHRIV